jgi:hypothetical protein
MARFFKLEKVERRSYILILIKLFGRMGAAYRKFTSGHGWRFWNINKPETIWGYNS